MNAKFDYQTKGKINNVYKQKKRKGEKREEEEEQQQQKMGKLFIVIYCYVILEKELNKLRNPVLIGS